MITIPNDRLLLVAQSAAFVESFRIADDIQRHAVQGISDIITIPGIINRDFADIRAHHHAGNGLRHHGHGGGERAAPGGGGSAGGDFEPAAGEHLD
ncbi:MAG: hypothetical protein ACRD1C_04785 [Terriglobales bacterium]